MKTQIRLIVTSVVLVCIGLFSNTYAVSPAPDGGYPGGNTAEGQSALLSLTTGGYNTALGFLSLRSNTTTSFNTAIGAGTLLANTADGNTATGAGALFSNTTGPSNTATGAFALFSNTTNGGSTATGYQALFANTGFGNTADGYQALLANTTGTLNTATGAQALESNTTGSSNIALGFQAGYSLDTGSNNICIGNIGLSGRSHWTWIGDNFSEVTIIGGIWARTTITNITLPVIVSEDGQLGTMSSSRRFKKEIKPMDQTSEAILSLKPVTFHYKSDKTGTPQFGLIAEDVAEVNPDLVVRDKNGEIYTVRYDAVNAMLLNEFLKEHNAFVEEQRTVQEQGVTIAELKKEINNLTATVKEQSAQIQKVSAQVEASSPVARMVLNSP